MNSSLNELLVSDYAPVLRSAFSDLREDVLYKSFVHGVGHVRRVMVLGAIIAMQQRIPLYDARLLLYACAYHDIGRKNDAVDDLHGERGADMLTPGLFHASTDEMACVKAAIAAHSTADGEIDRFIVKYCVPACMEGRCVFLSKCLKDADNLDRVRLGDLNLDYLRFSESKNLKALAEELFLEIRGEGILWQRFLYDLKRA